MKKMGDFWLPDIDMRWGRPHRKAVRIYRRGNGPKLGDLDEALKFVDRWTVAIDGGANVGAYSRVLMTRFEQTHAFEPMPDTYSALARNIQDWKGADRVRTYQCALSNCEENVAMETERGRRSVSARITGPGTIRTMRIDDLDLPDLAFLKLDIEGYEEKALEGAAESISHFKPLVMFEDKDHKSGQYGKPGAAHRLMESMGAKLLACVGPKQFDYIYGF